MPGLLVLPISVLFILVSREEVDIANCSRLNYHFGEDRRLEFIPQIVAVEIVILNRSIVDRVR